MKDKIQSLIDDLNPDSDLLLILQLNSKLDEITGRNIKPIDHAQISKSERSNALTGFMKSLGADMVHAGILGYKEKESYRGAYDYDTKSRNKLRKIVYAAAKDEHFNELLACKAIINRINRKLNPILYKFKHIHYATSQH